MFNSFSTTMPPLRLTMFLFDIFFVFMLLLLFHWKFYSLIWRHVNLKHDYFDRLKRGFYLKYCISKSQPFDFTVKKFQPKFDLKNELKKNVLTCYSARLRPLSPRSQSSVAWRRAWSRSAQDRSTGYQMPTIGYE